ncbi:MAG: HDOD domain-containing protein, partial [Rhodoferax sp.]
LLVSHIEHDPVIAGHVLSMANKAGTNRYGGAPINDVFTAISLVGLARVREVAILVSLADVFKGSDPGQPHGHFWHHSVAVGVCCVELAQYSRMDVHLDTALVAGLLHDVGQLWLQRFEPTLLRQAWDEAVQRKVDITVTERELMGVDHGQIGGWLAQGWGLGDHIVKAVVHHHAPEAALGDPLVAVVHVAEVLSNALDLTRTGLNRVTSISGAACATLGLDWGDDSHPLFGRIEARSRHAAAFFQG